MSRFLLYSHDTYGLGHLRRSSLLAGAIVADAPDHDALIVTGSPQAQAFTLPERVDTLKLPTATKDAEGAYQPRKLTGGIERLAALRGAVLLTTVEAYEPHVVIVDHAPTGMAGELLPLLRSLDRLPRRPRLVLGLRDIIDAADRVEAAWQRAGTWEWLRRYDDVLVYGDPTVPTTATELQLDRRLLAPVTHTGFVAPRMPDPVTEEPFLLVTPGGGGDGQSLLRRYLDAVEAGATEGLRSVVATGPLMSAARRVELTERVAGLPSVELVEFTDAMRSLISSAVGVVSMAGYNTVVEELAADVPALLVPRRAPRLEQELRARRLARRTRLEHCPLDAVTPRRLARFARSCVDRVPGVVDAPEVDLGGAAVAGDAIRGPRVHTPEPAACG